MVFCVQPQDPRLGCRNLVRRGGGPDQVSTDAQGFLCKTPNSQCLKHSAVFTGFGPGFWAPLLEPGFNSWEAAYNPNVFCWGPYICPIHTGMHRTNTSEWNMLLL